MKIPFHPLRVGQFSEDVSRCDWVELLHTGVIKQPDSQSCCLRRLTAWNSFIQSASEYHRKKHRIFEKEVTRTPIPNLAKPAGRTSCGRFESLMFRTRQDYGAARSTDKNTAMPSIRKLVAHRANGRGVDLVCLRHQASKEIFRRAIVKYCEWLDGRIAASYNPPYPSFPD